MAAPNPFPPFAELTSQDFQAYQQQLGDTSLQDPVGTLFEAAFASQKDFFSDRVRLALKAKLASIAPSDALTQIGIERGILQNPGEVDTAYATRLANAWNVWPWAGSARGVLRALYDAGYPNSAIVQQLGGYYTLDANQNLVLTSSPRWIFDVGSPLANPTAWAATTVYAQDSFLVPAPATGYFYTNSASLTSGSTQPVFPTTLGATVADGNGTWICHGRDFWSRFAVLFFTPFPSSWAGTPPADGTQEATRVKNLIAQWKSAHSTCVTIVSITSGQLWGWPIPRPTWGAPWRATWGTGCTPAPTYWTP